MQSGRRGFSSDYCGCWMESMCLLGLSGGVCVWVSLDLYVSHICALNRLLLSISTVGLFKNGRNIKKKVVAICLFRTRKVTYGTFLMFIPKSCL